MPKIVDFAYGYSTSTSGTTVACDTPATPTTTNAILVAHCSSDTGANNWSCAGWAQYYGALANGPGCALLWRAVDGTEAASYTFTSSAAETLDVTILSIIDVDSSSPFHNYAQANRASHNNAFPTVASVPIDALLLYLSTHPSTAAQPSSLEGPVTQLWQMDGSAHSDSIGWSIQPATGTSPNNVISSVSGTTYTGKLITVAIKPPSGGATIRPAYCGDDLSKYVDPLHGVTAFRGNSAFASTATTTNFGTTINGRALAASTVAAQTDKGINTYRSCAGMTSSTNRTWQGAVTALSAGNTITTGANKNFLSHIMPNLPIETQTLEGVGLERGVAMGMYSAAGNAKVWHVHGMNTPWKGARAPVVINSGATGGVKQSNGTLNANSIAGFGFFTSGFTTSADMVWTMLWMLDTTTVVGGNAAYPITVPDIVRVVADGKERMSALQQGKSQMLVLQPIQFGDGSKLTYLNLDSTAIEFPSQYDLESGQVFYNSVDDAAGLTYCPAAGDTIIHRSSVISSPSKYHWRIHASASASATYDFSGLSIIGAGDVQLRAVTAFTGMSFTTCPTITQNSAAIDSCNFTGSKIISATLGDMDNISNCDFTSSGTGHAIEVGGSASTITFTGNSFTGYAASNGSTGNEAIYVNIATGTVTINISGGTTPSIRTAGATVVVNNSKTKTFTGLPVGTEVRIRQGSYTLAQQQDVNTGSYAYSYTPDDKPAKAQFTLAGTVFEDIVFTRDSSDQSFPVTWAPDPSYTAS